MLKQSVGAGMANGMRDMCRDMIQRLRQGPRVYVLHPVTQQIVVYYYCYTIVPLRGRVSQCNMSVRPSVRPSRTLFITILYYVFEVDKFTTFWCNVSWGLRAPKIIEIGSRLTELFLKKQKGGGFLGTQCTCTLPPRGKTLNETLNIVLVYVDWLAVWRSGNSVVRVSRVDR